MKNIYRTLAKRALQARLRAHAPYSNFRVGSALLTKQGEIVTGCNIENSSYGLTICAERTAIFKAVSEGINGFVAIAIASDAPDFTPPCGACRQVLLDLAGGELDVLLVDHREQIKQFKLADLIPVAFTNQKLQLKSRKKR